MDKMNKNRITDIFGENVFNNDIMQKYMSDTTYKELRSVIDSGNTLDLDLANRVAEAMMAWASERGATHYTHWFQPLTGTTAEKHDSFISIDKKGNTILEFTGKNLSKGETDASNFPSGGIRATFEARGYTVWDCSSSAFLKYTRPNAATLYIPTAFCSYNGEALDKKTPLLRSMEALNKEGMRLLKLLKIDANRLTASVGGEQEYFLIDKNDYNMRTDLKFTGRTLFGAPPPKGQEQNDQYYATIRERVSLFMADLNDELWKLGITAKTQHNEAAPAQHELAPIFCTVNIATDQNQLIMETMRKVAEKNNLACLLHEKPFAGVNGSGKHNNWSITTDSGFNLLKPGKNPIENRIFLLFFTAVIAGVDEYAELIRMSAATPGNEHRLGGHEAPPSIISVYIGDDLEQVLDNILAGNTVAAATKQFIKMGVNYLAELSKDTSDRNRTSPFAFTGNKFEFRMVGSSATLSTPNVMLNTITAEMMSRISDELENTPEELRHDAILEIIKRQYKDHKRIIFKGNNYTKEWAREAKRRGLKNYANCVDAYEVLVAPKNIELFRKHNVMTAKELESRREIYLDTYNKTINCESTTMLSMFRTEILPSLMHYQRDLAETVAALKNIGIEMALSQTAILVKMDNLMQLACAQADELAALHEQAKKVDDSKRRAILYRDQITVAMEHLRKIVDSIELIIPKNILPYPNYADLMFYE